MKYQLANGRTITLSDEQYWKMTDQDFKDLEGTTYGHEINDPFYDSVLDGEIPDLDLQKALEDDPFEDYEEDED